MASVYISCPSPLLTCTSHTTRARKMGLQNRSNYTQRIAATALTTAALTVAEPVARRSGNYPPTLWPNDYLQSLASEYSEEKYKKRLHSLNEEVRKMILEDVNMKNLLSRLELVDELYRLGISYHFEDEISSVLNTIYDNYYKTHDKWNKLDLNLKALGFRLLRQYGCPVAKEIFDDSKDEAGNFKASLYEDIVGILNLYEASFFLVGGESILDEAREFTSKCLRTNLEEKKITDQSLSELISHALRIPLRWRDQKSESVWFIDVYDSRKGMNPLLLELAKLDFNILQALYQEDLKQLSRWWEGLGWDKKLSFARDRLVDSFMWGVTSGYKPQFGPLRRCIGKLVALITVCDDVYDLYGTLDELERFTNAIERWDINAIEDLPDYMQICFLGFYNTINEIAYELLTSKGFHALPYLKKAWTDYSKANLAEARWYYNRYTPTLEEYLENARYSISVPVMLTHAYFFTTSSITKEALEYLETCQNMVHCSAMLLRLADDLGTSLDEMEKGDVAASIQCYMNQTSASEEDARAHIRNLILDTYKKLNKELFAVNSHFSKAFLDSATNFGTYAQFVYQYEDDQFGSPNALTKPHAASLFFNPKS